jgi:hypothetical protein
VQLEISAVEVDPMRTPPPLPPLFPMNRQLVSVAAQDPQTMKPPPTPELPAALNAKMQSTQTGWQFSRQYIPPALPFKAVFEARMLPITKGATLSSQ